jgi:hypothetical protein
MSFKIQNHRNLRVEICSKIKVKLKNQGFQQLNRFIIIPIYKYEFRLCHACFNYIQGGKLRQASWQFYAFKYYGVKFCSKSSNLDQACSFALK